MLTAKEAKEISENPIAWLESYILKEARKGRTSVVLDFSLPPEHKSLLWKLGYTVTQTQEDVFGEIPYGYTDEVISCKFSTLIEWTEPR